MMPKLFHTNREGANEKWKIAVSATVTINHRVGIDRRHCGTLASESLGMDSLRMDSLRQGLTGGMH